MSMLNVSSDWEMLNEELNEKANKYIGYLEQGNINSRI